MSGKLYEVPPPITDVKETLQSMLERADTFEGVIILALNRDGTQYLQTSSMSHMQRSFLVGFVNAWHLKWFHEHYDDDK